MPLEEIKKYTEATIHTFGCHYCNNNGLLSGRGLNDEDVNGITQYLHGKPF